MNSEASALLQLDLQNHNFDHYAFFWALECRSRQPLNVAFRWPLNIAIDGPWISLYVGITVLFDGPHMPRPEVSAP